MRVLSKKAACIMLPVFILVTGFFMPTGDAQAATRPYSTSGVSIPSDMFQGKSFTVKGKVYSKTVMKKLIVGVTTTKGKWVSNAHYVARPYSKSYNLHNADDKIIFGKLKTGTYRYRVCVYNGSKRTMVVNRSFRVRNLAAKNVSYPVHMYYGKPFIVKGRIVAKSKVKYVKAGVTNKYGIWMPGAFKSAWMNTSSYDLNEMDTSIAFSKLSPGTYYYKVYAKSADVKKTMLVCKKFTVSRMKITGATKPGALSLGKGFVLKGKVKSTYNLRTVRVGIQTTSRKWKNGFTITKYPRKTTFNVASVDANIRFGKLARGTYYYCIWSKDAYGKSKTVLAKRFTVGKTSTYSSSSGSSGGSYTGKLKSGGQILRYNSSLISSTIGPQPYSGPCGIYAMAYVRAVRDGYFSRGNYYSVHSKLISVYGHGSSAAHWYEAGGVSTYYSSARSCYKKAISEVAHGRPCIINLHNGNTGNNHYVTVIGYVAGTTYNNVTLSKLIVLDPGYGTRKYLSQMNYYNSSYPQCITFSK